MIVRPRPHWLRMLFVWQGSVLRRILVQLLTVAGLSLLVTFFHGELFHWKVTLNAVPFTLIGVSLAIFLSFRINASYDRYWEARKLWGALLSDARILARQAMTLIDVGDAENAAAAHARPFVLGLAAFSHALRHQLRGLDGADQSGELGRLLPAEVAQAVRTATQRPMRILRWLGEWLAVQRRAGRLQPILAATMEPALASLTLAATGCERIAGSRLPFTYSVIIHRTVYLYCALLPFGLVDAIGPMTPLIVVFVAYAFLALEAVSDEIEEPFGFEPNDLPLDALSIGIERSLRELLGDLELPPLPLAKDWVLS